MTNSVPPKICPMGKNIADIFTSIIARFCPTHKNLHPRTKKLCCHSFVLG